MSLLTMVTEFCELTGLTAPSAVLGSADPQVKQIRALLQAEGNDLSMRGEWEGLTVEALHTTIAAEDQGAITTIASDGYRYISHDTMWDRTDMLPVPLLGSTKWQQLKATVNAAPRYRYRIRGGRVLMSPIPPVGHTVAFEYLSANWITSSDGVTKRSVFAADSDITRLPEQLLLLGLRWRWKREKGFEYAEDFRTYEMQVTTYLGRDGGKPVLRMDEGDQTTRPGIVVPEYSWPI